jgi:predicted nicotinamide N-methyase
MAVAEEADTSPSSSDHLTHVSDVSSEPEPQDTAEADATDVDVAGLEAPKLSARCSKAVQKSDWGLFQREVRTVKRRGDIYKSYAYHCGDNIVELRKPVSGTGTRLMYGDFARKLSFAEEAMAFYILKHRSLFTGCRVLVLGAGLGFAGLACATCCDAAYVEITDGDPEVVRTLQASVALNQGSFGETEVVAHELPFSEHQSIAKLERASYDIVLAADIVYASHFHDVIVELVARVLRPTGTFILFSPRRGTSLNSFVAKARAAFPYTDESSNYDPEVSRIMNPLPKCFPIMVSVSFSQAARSLLWSASGSEQGSTSFADLKCRSDDILSSRSRSRPPGLPGTELDAEDAVDGNAGSRRRRSITPRLSHSSARTSRDRERSRSWLAGEAEAACESNAEKSVVHDAAPRTDVLVLEECGADPCMVPSRPSVDTPLDRARKGAPTACLPDRLDDVAVPEEELDVTGSKRDAKDAGRAKNCRALEAETMGETVSRHDECGGREVSGQLLPGLYYILEDEVLVRSTQTLENSELVSFLSKGSYVRVAEIAEMETECFVLGRIDNPKGWIPLQHSGTGFRWAAQVEEPPCSSTQVAAGQPPTHARNRRSASQRPPHVEAVVPSILACGEQRPETSSATSTMDLEASLCQLGRPKAILCKRRRRPTAPPLSRLSQQGHVADSRSAPCDGADDENLDPIVRKSSLEGTNLSRFLAQNAEKKRVKVRIAKPTGWVSLMDSHRRAPPTHPLVSTRHENRAHLSELWKEAMCQEPQPVTFRVSL